MASLSLKENFMRCITGGVPEFVPRYYGGVDPYATLPQQTAGMPLSVNARQKSARGYNMDVWGVEYIGTEETGGQELPVPGEFKLDDIRKWRDVVKAPDLSDVNWELVAQRDLANLTFNPEEVAVTGGGGGGYFMPHMNLMGFTNGLISYFEEPEEVKALYEYFSEYWAICIENVMKYYPIDIFTVSDDSATENNPFISPDMQREFLVPMHAKNCKIAYERGKHVMMHNCGRCEDSIPDWIDFGVDSWNPAQLENDLDGIKAKYGNKMVIIGAWDSSGPAGWFTSSEEFVKNAVKETIMRFGPGGGYMFWGSVYGPPDYEPFLNKRKWLAEAYMEYRELPYK
jgi:hypothetical protein